jgi:hypothetical protein
MFYVYVSASGASVMIVLRSIGWSLCFLLVRFWLQGFRFVTRCRGRVQALVSIIRRLLLSKLLFFLS